MNGSTLRRFYIARGAIVEHAPVSYYDGERSCYLNDGERLFRPTLRLLGKKVLRRDSEAEKWHRMRERGLTPAEERRERFLGLGPAWEDSDPLAEIAADRRLN